MAFERQENVTGRVLTCTEFCLFCIAEVEITEAGEAVEIVYLPVGKKVQYSWDQKTRRH